MGKNFLNPILSVLLVEVYYHEKTIFHSVLCVVLPKPFRSLLGTSEASFTTHLSSPCTEAEFMNVPNLLRFLGRMLRVFRLEVSVHNI
jgi:hypothetical protein